MKKQRLDPTAFNPEKFLAKEAKTRTARSRLEARTVRDVFIETVLPVRFSAKRRKTFIARICSEVPEAVYRGDGLEKFESAIAALKAEIRKELEGCGLIAEPTLVQMLFMDVVSDSQWRRRARAQKKP